MQVRPRLLPHRIVLGPAGSGSMLLLLAIALAGSPAFGAWPIDIPERYSVTGEVVLRVEELGDFRGRMSATLIEHPDGTITVSRLGADIRDFDIVRRRVFRDDERTPFRCNRLVILDRLEGALAAGSRTVTFTPPLSLHGSSWEARSEDGCPGAGRFVALEVLTRDPVVGVHDPEGDVFALGGTFLGDVDGETFTVHLDVDGSYSNRPPLARFGVVGEGIPTPAIKGACPPTTSRTFEFALGTFTLDLTQANGPHGLELTAESLSRDPDGVWARSAIADEQWARFSRHPFTGEEDYAFLGRGRSVGPIRFEMGLVHKLQLTVTDPHGAIDRAECEFSVVDSLPPVITVPARTTVSCTVEGGATPGSSGRLRAFLDGAGAEDRVDPSPLALPPRVGGVEVGPGTLFPLDEWTEVEFRFRDRFENLATQRSQVRVTDTTPPQLLLELPGGVVQAERRAIKIEPRVFVRDDCSRPTFRLESVISDDPALVEAVPSRYVDEPVRELEILAPPRRVPSDRAPRTYVVTYVAVDAAGNETRVSRKLRVAPATDGREP